MWLHGWFAGAAMVTPENSVAIFYEQAAGGQLNGFLAIMIPILCSLLGSLLMGLLYCFLTVTLRANQNVTGLAMTTFGVGVGNFFGGSLIKLTNSEVPSIALANTSLYFKTTLPGADNRHVAGSAHVHLADQPEVFDEVWRRLEAAAR